MSISMLLFTDLFEQLHLLAERRLVPGHQQAAEAAGHAAEAGQLHCACVQCAWLQILSTVHKFCNNSNL